MFIFLWQSVFRVSDIGIGVILSFLAMLVFLLGKTLGAESLKAFASLLPKSVHAGRKLLGKNTDPFSKIVCCPKCSTLYEMDSCILTQRNGSKSSRHCSHIAYPNHPQQSRRLPCDTILMKSVTTFAGTSYLYPRQMYCYRSVIDHLKEKLCMPNFIQQCELWRSRKTRDNVYDDIFDGQIWTDFLDPEGTPFLSVPYNFAFSLNVDWFQPFKHSQYSCGAMYVSILNLPRSERFSAENVILIGIIPGPSEPELTINSFLEPFVAELLDLWSGVIMKTCDSTVLVRAALLCVACDIPAARKVCGYTGHNSLHACSRCLKTFPTESFGEKPDFTGFDREKWPARKLPMHRMHATHYLGAKSRTEQKKLERTHGCRYSILLKLPYFDPIRMCIIDPMHNLLLGTAKHMLTIWKDLNFLTHEHFKVIQEKVDNFHTPEDVGRIPTKISSGFSGFSADQWRNWVLLFSLFSLKGILPYSHYNCWQLFVKACHILCCRSISKKKIDEADTLLHEFCISFDQLYGKKYCTINIHLHGHLHECLKDYGPVYAFWLFSFERLNGVLGAFHTNNHDISLQLMRLFLRSHEFGIHTISNDYKQDFIPLIEKCVYNKGSLKQTCLQYAVLEDENVLPLPPVHISPFTLEEREDLQNTILKFANLDVNQVTVLTSFQKCRSLQVGGFLLGSVEGRHKSAAFVLASPLQHTGRPKLAKIYYFAKCSYVYTTEHTSTCWLAVVKFFLEHDCRVWYGYPTEVWTKMEASSPSFIPLSHIASRVSYIDTQINFGRIIGTDSVFVVSPI